MAEKGLLTLTELMDRLSVSRSWIYKKVAARIIPHFRVGGTLRFSEREINEWLESHHVSGCQKI